MVDWLVEVPVAVEFCAGAGVDVDVDGDVVVVVEPGWLWVVVEVAGAVDGDCANAAVANARLMADVVKSRIFILFAPVVRLLPPLNGVRRPRFRKSGKTGNALACGTPIRGPEAPPGVNRFASSSGGEGTFAIFCRLFRNASGHNKTVYTCLFGAISHFPAAFFSRCCCWQIGTCRNRRQSLRGLRSTRP